MDKIICEKYSILVYYKKWGVWLVPHIEAVKTDFLYEKSELCIVFVLSKHLKMMIMIKVILK